MRLADKSAKSLRLMVAWLLMEGSLSHAPSIPLSMPDDTQILGRCPDCGDEIPEAWLLVEYTKDDGTEGIWAECPTCEDVVAPE